jgi:hypothetical protein
MWVYVVVAICQLLLTLLLLFIMMGMDRRIARTERKVAAKSDKPVASDRARADELMTRWAAEQGINFNGPYPLPPLPSHGAWVGLMGCECRACSPETSLPVPGIDPAGIPLGVTTALKLPETSPFFMPWWEGEWDEPVIG